MKHSLFAVTKLLRHECLTNILYLCRLSSQIYTQEIHLIAKSCFFFINNKIELTKNIIIEILFA